METEYDVFLCHNSLEKAAIRDINTVLRQDFGLATFLDEGELVAGEPWERRIETALARSKACAVLLGGQGWGKYQLEGEVVPALTRRAQEPNFRLIPVLMPGFDERLVTIRRDVEDLFVKTMWIDLREGVGPVSMRLLAASIRGEHAFPEGPPRLTAARVRFDAIRWDVARGDTTLLYQGKLLDDAAALVENDADEGTLTQDFLAASRRHQNELIGSRLAAHARALLNDPKQVELAVALADEATKHHTTPEAIDVLHTALTRIPRVFGRVGIPSAVTKMVAGPAEALIGCAGGEVLHCEPKGYGILPKKHAGGVTSLMFDPDDRWFATGGADGLIHIWNIVDRAWVTTLTFGEPVTGLHAKSGPGGDWLLAHSAELGRSGHVKVWNVAAGWTEDFRWGPRATQGAVLEAGARMVLLAWGDHVAIASADTGKMLEALPVKAPVVALSAHPTKSAFALTTMDGSLWFGELGDHRRLDRVRGDIGQVGTLHFSPSGRWLAALGRDGLLVYDTESGASPLRLPYEGLFKIEALFSPDEMHVAVYSGETGGLTVWNLAERSRIYAGGRPEEGGLAFLDSTRLAATGNDNTVELLELPSLDPAVWTQNPYVSNVLTFSPDERWLAWTGSRVKSDKMPTASFGALLTVTEVVSGRELLSTDLGELGEQLSFDPDSTVVAVRVGERTRGFSLVEGASSEAPIDESWFPSPVDLNALKLKCLELPKVQQACASRGLRDAFPSPSGRWLAIFHERHLVSLWDTSKGSETLNFTTSAKVSRCVFDDAETRVAFGDEWGGIAIWTTSGQDQMRLRHSDGIFQLAFSPRGTYLAASSADGCVRLWVADRAELSARVRKRTSRQMTDDDWAVYFPGLRST